MLHVVLKKYVYIFVRRQDRLCQALAVTALKNIINMAQKDEFYFSFKTLQNSDVA